MFLHLVFINLLVLDVFRLVRNIHVCLFRDSKLVSDVRFSCINVFESLLINMEQEEELDVVYNLHHFYMFTESQLVIEDF